MATSVRAWTWWQGGGLGWKGRGDHGSVEKPPVVRSNHSRLSIILPPSATSIQPITPQRCLSSPFHYSHLTGQKIRVTLGGPLSSPRPFFSLSLHLPLVLFLTHYSQFTGWYMEGDTGPIQSLVPVSHSAFLSAAALPSMAIPLQRVVTLFSTLHTSPALLCYTGHSISWSVTPVFHLLVFFFSLPLTFKSPVSLGRCFEMALLCWDSEMLHCAAAPVEIVGVSR